MYKREEEEKRQVAVHSILCNRGFFLFNETPQLLKYFNFVCLISFITLLF
jgi:hypothetical protein